jgi:alpha-glucan,water dikinase
VPFDPLLEVTLEAADQPLLWDPHTRGQLISSISAVGQAVEAAFGGVAQDIEGVVLPQGQVVVVQSRPQVLPTAAAGSNGSSAR